MEAPLLQVQHQTVRLTVNPHRCRLRGSTDIIAAAPPSTTQAVGLHLGGQDVSAVWVNGLEAQFSIREGPPPGLPSDAQGVPHSTARISEQAFFDYLSLVQHEVGPQLVVTLPPGWDAQYKQQQQSSLGPLDLQSPPSAATKPSEAAAAQGESGALQQQEGQEAGVGTTMNSRPDQEGGHMNGSVSAAGGQEPMSVDTPAGTGAAAAGASSGALVAQPSTATAGELGSNGGLLPLPSITASLAGGGAGSTAVGGGDPDTPRGTAVTAGIAGGGSTLQHQHTVLSPDGGLPAGGAAGGAGAAGKVVAPPAPPMSVRIVFSRGLSANESTSLLLLSGASAVAKAASPLDVALAQASLNDRAGLTKTAAGNNHDLSSNGLVNGHHQEGMGALPQAGAPAAAALSSDVYVVPDPAIRRARALFPCIDAVGSLATYDISVTVPPGLVAVCGGELRENELSLVQLPGGGGEVPHSRTFRFSVHVPVTAAHLLLTIGPFVTLPQLLPPPPGAGGPKAEGVGGTAGPVVTVCVPPGLESEALHTVRPLYLILHDMEKYLNAPFPFPQLSLVFVPPAAFLGKPLSERTATGAGIILATSELLVGPDDVEGSVTSRLMLARALAHQWFGSLLLPRTPEDSWVMEALASHLEDAFARKWLGQNEVLWRRYKEREAVLLADDGSLPPLCPRPGGRTEKGKAAAALVMSGPTTYGNTYGTEMLEPGPIRRWKAAAVMRMLELRAGEDQIKELMRAMVRGALTDLEGPTTAGGTGAAPAAAPPQQAPGDGAVPASQQQQQPGPGDQQQPGGTTAAGGPSGPAQPGGAAAPPATEGRAHADRLLSTSKFLRTIGQKTGYQASGPFAERWVYGRGVPNFTLGFSFKAKTNTMDLALRQGGSAASRRSALSALKAAKASNADESMNHVRVFVAESDGVSEALVRVSPDDVLILHEDHLVSSKPASKRVARKSKALDAAREDPLGTAAPPAPDAEGGPGGEEAAGAMVPGGPRHPVQFLRLDPAGEWLAGASVLQPEPAWVSQLEKSRDVIAQSLAVAALASLAGSFERPSLSAVQALAACLRNPRVFCRVRAEAALALGATAGADNSCAAVPILCKYLFDATHDPTSLVLRPNSFSDLAEHAVLCALPMAAALTSNEYGDSPQEVLDLLLGFLAQVDNSGNQFSDAHYIACWVEALGRCRPRKPEQLEALLMALDRALAMEDLSPSPQYVIARAALGAMGRVAINLAMEQRDDVRAAVRKVLTVYAGPGVPLPLRLVAARNLLALEAACVSDAKVGALLDKALELCACEGWGAAGRAAVMREALELLGGILAARDEDEETEAQRIAVDPTTVLYLYRIMHSTQDARTRQYVFMILQRVAGQDATLYREREEEPEVVPAHVLQQQQLPEASLPSGGAGTPQHQPLGQKIKIHPLKLRLGKAGGAPGAAGDGLLTAGGPTTSQQPAPSTGGGPPRPTTSVQGPRPTASGMTVTTLSGAAGAGMFGMGGAAPTRSGRPGRSMQLIGYAANDEDLTSGVTLAETAGHTFAAAPAPSAPAPAPSMLGRGRREPKPSILKQQIQEHQQHDAVTTAAAPTAEAGEGVVVESKPTPAAAAGPAAAQGSAAAGEPAGVPGAAPQQGLPAHARQDGQQQQQQVKQQQPSQSRLKQEPKEGVVTEAVSPAKPPGKPQRQQQPSNLQQAPASATPEAAAEQGPPMVAQAAAQQAPRTDVSAPAQMPAAAPVPAAAAAPAAAAPRAGGGLKLKLKVGAGAGPAAAPAAVPQQPAPAPLPTQPAPGPTSSAGAPPLVTADAQPQPSGHENGAAPGVTRAVREASPAVSLPRESRGPGEPAPGGGGGGGQQGSPSVSKPPPLGAGGAQPGASKPPISRFGRGTVRSQSPQPPHLAAQPPQQQQPATQPAPAQQEVPAPQVAQAAPAAKPSTTTARAPSPTAPASTAPDTAPAPAAPPITAVAPAAGGAPKIKLKFGGAKRAAETPPADSQGNPPPPGHPLPGAEAAAPAGAQPAGGARLPSPGVGPGPQLPGGGLAGPGAPAGGPGAGLPPTHPSGAGPTRLKIKIGGKAAGAQPTAPAPSLLSVGGARLGSGAVDSPGLMSHPEQQGKGRGRTPDNGSPDVAAAEGNAARKRLKREQTMYSPTQTIEKR